MRQRRSIISGKKVAWSSEQTHGRNRPLPGMRPSERREGKLLMGRLAMARLPDAVVKEAKRQLDSGSMAVKIKASDIAEESRLTDAGFKREGQGVMIYTLASKASK